MLVRDDVSKVRKYLPELFDRDLEMLVSVPVLEEALGVQSVLYKQVSKTFSYLLSKSFLPHGRTLKAILSRRTSIIQRNIDVLLESLLSENLFDVVTEISPTNVPAFFWCCVVVAEKVKFSLRKHNFTHVQTDSKLCISDKSTSEFVEVPHELLEPDSLLLSFSPEFGQDILDIIRSVSNNVGGDFVSV